MANPAPDTRGLIPWKKGNGSPNPGGVSRERRELYRAIEQRQIPKVLDLLDALYDRALGGSDVAARLWLDHVRGPVKPRDDDAIESAVEQKVMEMIADARARKAGAPIPEPPPVEATTTSADGETSEP